MERRNIIEMKIKQWSLNTKKNHSFVINMIALKSSLTTKIVYKAIIKKLRLAETYKMFLSFCLYILKELVKLSEENT